MKHLQPLRLLFMGGFLLLIGSTLHAYAIKADSLPYRFAQRNSLMIGASILDPFFGYYTFYGEYFGKAHPRISTRILGGKGKADGRYAWAVGIDQKYIPKRHYRKFSPYVGLGLAMAELHPSPLTRAKELDIRLLGDVQVQLSALHIAAQVVPAIPIVFANGLLIDRAPGFTVALIAGYRFGLE